MTLEGEPLPMFYLKPDETGRFNWTEPVACQFAGWFDPNCMQSC